MAFMENVRTASEINQTYQNMQGTAGFGDISVYEEAPIIPPNVTFGIEYVSPTPDNNDTIGFDYALVINFSYTNVTVPDNITLFWKEGSNPFIPYLYDIQGTEPEYREFTPNFSSGNVYTYYGVIWGSDVSNQTDNRTLKVSSLTQEQLDEGLGGIGAEINWGLILLFLVLFVLIYVLIRH